VAYEGRPGGPRRLSAECIDADTGSTHVNMAAAGRQQHQQQEEPDADDVAFDMDALDQFDYFRFTLTDMHGIGRTMSVPRRHVEHCLHDGLGFYAGTSASPRLAALQTPHPTYSNPVMTHTTGYTRMH